ncbi:hypothetical protein CYMTET_27846 [Cymbomonas tetramitiformis]|uniref:Right handed beta helix domain-containing protein n=1 Tax=Cymbomonas tetramitiformis TaxID=36881 RepID=A0AAE0FP45_9CHLO|nr:hypothetical protein CYMTET_27846 [Cymbomonas tetramitiformis]
MKEGVVMVAPSGAIYGSQSAVSVFNSNISLNAVRFDGAGVFMVGAMTMKLEASRIVKNFAQNSGGGIAVNNGVQLMLCNNTMVESNTASVGGGIIATGQGTFVSIMDTILSANVPTLNQVAASSQPIAFSPHSPKPCLAASPGRALL